MAVITKSGASLIALQSIASNTVVISAVQDVSTKLAATVHIHFGRRVATALTAAMTFRVEGSSRTSGDGHWYTIFPIGTDIVAVEAEALTGTVAAGQNVLTLASTTNLTVGDLIYIDNPTIGNSEWGRIKAVSVNTSVTIEDNLLFAQTGSTIYDGAHIFPPIGLDLSAVRRLRLVCDGSNTGQAVAVEADIVFADSIE